MSVDDLAPAQQQGWGIWPRAEAARPRSAAICARSVISRCLSLVAAWARSCCCCCQNNLSVSEATHFLGEFHRIFPTIRIAMDALTKKVAQDGYVKTLFERRRSV